MSETNGSVVPPDKRGAQAFGRTAVQGAVYFGLAQILKILIALASTIVIARILSPSDYGVVAMTTPIANFLAIFQNLGLNQALVQAQTLRKYQVNALFFYNMLASLALAVVFLLLSPFVGLFYGDDRPAAVMAASAATIIVTGSTLQHTALLTRAMRYRLLSTIDVVVATSILLFTLAFALLWQSYWALWAGAFCGALVNAILVWRYDPWRPRRRVVLRSARALVKFGANLTGFNVLNFLCRNLDNVLIARAWGADSVGLYDRSYKLMMMPIQNVNAPLARIMLPILSRVRDDPPRYRRIYLLSIRILGLCSVPGAMAAAMCSDQLVPLLLGPAWSAASPIFFWLSLAGATQPISNAVGWIMISQGRADRMFRWSLVSAPVTILTFFIGLPWGPTGVAAAYFFGQLVLSPLLYAWGPRDTPIRSLDIYASLAPNLIGSALAWGVIVMLREALSPLSLFALAILLCYLLSTIVQAALPQSRAQLVEFVGILRSMVKSRRKGV